MNFQRGLDKVVVFALSVNQLFDEKSINTFTSNKVICPFLFVHSSTVRSDSVSAKLCGSCWIWILNIDAHLLTIIKTTKNAYHALYTSAVSSSSGTGAILESPPPLSPAGGKGVWRWRCPNLEFSWFYGRLCIFFHRERTEVSVVGREVFTLLLFSARRLPCWQLTCVQEPRVQLTCVQEPRGAGPEMPGEVPRDLPPLPPCRGQIRPQRYIAGSSYTTTGVQSLRDCVFLTSVAAPKILQTWIRIVCRF